MTLGLAVTFRYNTKSMVHERRFDKLDFIELKIFYFAKVTVKRMKRQPQKGLLSKIYKEYLKLNNKKMNGPTKKMGKRSEQTPPPNRRYTSGNKHRKRCATSYVIRGLQIKTTMRYHYTPIIMTKIQNTNNTNEDVEQRELSLIVGWNAKWYSHFGRSLAVSYKTKHTLTI